MALELAQNRGHRVAGEHHLTRAVEAIDGLQQSDRGDLDEILDRLVGVLVAARKASCERQVALDEQLTGVQIAIDAHAGKELEIGQDRRHLDDRSR